jgi:hypothetical protein
MSAITSGRQRRGCLGSLQLIVRCVTEQRSKQTLFVPREASPLEMGRLTNTVRRRRFQAKPSQVPAVQAGYVYRRFAQLLLERRQHRMIRLKEILNVSSARGPRADVL